MNGRHFLISNRDDERTIKNPIRIEVEHYFEDIVYLKTDVDQLERMVTGIYLRPGAVVYELACGDTATDHYGMEISAQRKL